MMITIPLAEQRIERAQSIVNDLLVTGVDQWEDAEKHYPDDWKYVDEVRAKKVFAYELLNDIDQTESALILCRKLLIDVIETFENLTYKWDERELEEVPDVVDGIKKAKQWLEHYGLTPEERQQLKDNFEQWKEGK